MNHLYSYKYRLYPTQDQKVLLNKHFGCCRWIYNHFLEKRIAAYETDKITLYFSDNCADLPGLKLEFPWLKEVNAQSLQSVVKNLQSAYDHFFRRIKERKQGSKVKPGFPVFKTKYDRQSFKIPQRVEVKNNLLIIPKFLEGISINLHRELTGEIRFATISRNKAGQYHVSITVKKETQELSPTTQTIGLDLNVVNIVDNHNNQDPNPRPGELHKKRSRFLHKAVSRTQPHSKGRNKAQSRFNKFHEYCHQVREDFQHKLSRRLIDENQVICVEDLSVASMLETNDQEPKWKQKKFHRMIQDCAFFAFIAKLTYKALWYGRTLIKVDRYFPSSQLCNHCGWRYWDLPRDCKEWICPECFWWNDRNHNAAQNVHDEGMRLYYILTSGTEEIAGCPGIRPEPCSGVRLDRKPLAL